MRILVTRPEPDGRLEAEALAARGHEPVRAPLLAIEFVADAPLDLAGAQALIATSRNALRALAAYPAHVQALELPLFAVGEATARAAQALGFTQVTIGLGTGATLAEAIHDTLAPQAGDLVHLAGDTLAFDFKPELEADGFGVRRVVLYRAIPADALPAEALAMLEGGALDAAIFLSPRTARTFVDLAARHGAVTQAKGLVCYCLSEAVAEAVAPLGATVRVAATPREEDVLALLDSEAASS